MTSAELREIRIAIALKEYADMTGVHPDVTTEALVRLHREGMINCGHPATLKRFRELIDDVTRERAGMMVREG